MSVNIDEHEFDLAWGEPVDTVDGRLAAIARLIDGIGDEVDLVRRHRRTAVALRLLDRLVQQFDERISEQLDRIDQT